MTFTVLGAGSGVPRVPSDLPSHVHLQLLTRRPCLLIAAEQGPHSHGWDLGLGHSPCPTLPVTIGLSYRIHPQALSAFKARSFLGLMTPHRLRHPSSYLHSHREVLEDAGASIPCPEVWSWGSELMPGKPLSSFLRAVWLIMVHFSSPLFGPLLTIWGPRIPSEPPLYRANHQPRHWSHPPCLALCRAPGQVRYKTLLLASECSDLQVNLQTDFCQVLCARQCAWLSIQQRARRETSFAQLDTGARSSRR